MLKQTTALLISLVTLASCSTSIAMEPNIEQLHAQIEAKRAEMRDAKKAGNCNRASELFAELIRLTEQCNTLMHKRKPNKHLGQRPVIYFARLTADEINDLKSREAKLVPQIDQKREEFHAACDIGDFDRTNILLVELTNLTDELNVILHKLRLGK